MEQFHYLTLVDFLLIAGAGIGIESRDPLDNDELVARANNGLWAAASSAYPDLLAKAAALEFTLIRNRPLPKENVLVAHECMKEFARRNAHAFEAERSEVDPDGLFAAIIDGDPDAFTRLASWLAETIVPA